MTMIKPTKDMEDELKKEIGEETQLLGDDDGGNIDFIPLEEEPLK